ncbi:hypothetical protein ABEW30_20785 [Paenibacillus lautus]
MIKNYTFFSVKSQKYLVLSPLLYLGVKNIHLGPTLPAFLSPNVVEILVDKFGIGGITNMEEDMKMFLGRKGARARKTWPAARSFVYWLVSIMRQGA